MNTFEGLKKSMRNPENPRDQIINLFGARTLEGYVKYSVYQLFHLYTKDHRLFYIGLRHLTGKLTVINGREIFDGTESSEVNIKQTLLNVGKTKRFEHYIVEGMGPNDFYVKNIRKVGDIDSWNYLKEEWKTHNLDKIIEFRKQFIGKI